MKLMIFFSLGAGNRIFGLDLLRFFAIIYVVLGHSKILLPEQFDTYIGKTILDGVSIFFVLSGFLIGQILIKQINRGETNFKALTHFWSRRWLRTLPAYLFVLILIVSYTAYLKPSRLPEEWYKYFYFMQNMFEPIPPFFGESWSLSVEEWFYLITPILFFVGVRLFQKNKKLTLLILIISMIIAVVLYRFYLYNHLVLLEEKHVSSVMLKQVIPRLDGIMIGVLGAFLATYYNVIWDKLNKWYVFVLMFLLLYIIKQFNSSTESAYFCVYVPLWKSLAVFFMLPYLSKLEIKKPNLIVRFITFVSITSYSIYLLNRTIVIDVIFKYVIHGNLKDFHSIEKNWEFEYILFWIITFILSFLMYKLIEKPFLKLRDISKK